MQVRYLGFEQAKGARAYQFDVLEDGVPTRQFIVTVDLALFRAHQVGIQEGPTLCAGKLKADLIKGPDGLHELTGEDLRAYSAARTLEQERRAELRQSGRRRGAPPASAGTGPAGTDTRSGWRNFGI